MKKIFSIFKKLLFAFFLLYGFNMLYGTFKINIPINMCTICLTAFLGFPGFLGILFVHRFI